MATLQIKVKLGTKGKTLQTSSKRITLGKSPDCGVTLPFAWLEDVHLIIDNADNILRVKPGSAAAHASLWGDVLGSEWTVLASPSRLVIPAPKGYSLVLDVSSIDPAADVMILQESAQTGSRGATIDEIPIDLATKSRFGGSPEQSEFRGDDLRDVRSVDSGAATTTSQKLLLAGSVMFAVVLILGAFGINRVEDALSKKAIDAATALIRDHIAMANDFIARQDYVGAKNALDTAQSVAVRNKLPELAAEVANLRASSAVALGSRGYVEMDGQWLSPDRARAWKLARDRDDPTISELEQQAAIAVQNKKFDEGRAACEQALALIATHPVHPHPREAALRSQLETIKTEGLTAEMLVKGYVQYGQRWVTPEERFRLDAQAKGLVEYQGEWMTRDEMAATEKRGGTGRVLYEGKWVTPDQKMQAQGYVQFEGHWIRPEERDATQASRQAQKDQAAAADKKAVDEQVAAATAEKLKRTAYAKSQDILAKKYAIAAGGHFEAFGNDKVQVIFDDGWYIVRAVVTLKGTPAAKTYYCKLRPQDGDAWEADTTIIAE